MRAFLETWITLARLRRRVGKPSIDTWIDDRQQWLRDHAPERSVVDVGGLFSVDGAYAFLAEDAGASRVTLLDAGDVEYAPGFAAERTRRGSAVRYVQGDLHDPETIRQVGVHDVVFCTGVIYHSPHPVHQLLHLREITGELLYLGTHTIPEVPGVPQACLYYPYLDDAARRPLARAYWSRTRAGLLGIGHPFDDRPMHGYGNFWWGITPSALRAMLLTARFEIVEERRTHPYPWYVELVARPIDKDPLLPPTDYYRRRREAWSEGQELAWEDFYAKSEDGLKGLPRPASS